MPIAPLAGHESTRRILATAVRANRLPQVLLVTGPGGCGRQRLGLWLAQLLACQERDDEPCGRCRGCRLVLDLAHPDLHWLVPIPRPKAGDPDKQVEEAAESLAEVMAERRATGRWSAPDGMSIHGVASARLLQRRAALRPSEGGHSVFLIGDAERLVPQGGNTEAANTLLKLLEEPPSRAIFLLTAAEPGAVLPTIRSRAVPIRMGRLPEAQVREFLATHGGLSPTQAAERAAGAEGCIGRGLSDGTADATRKATAAAAAFLEAVRRDPAEAYALALRQAPWQARGEFTDLLDALLRQLGESARGASGAPARRAGVSKVPRRPAGSLPRLVEAIQKVQAARRAAQGNANPQLLLAGLCADLAGAL